MPRQLFFLSGFFLFLSGAALADLVNENLLVGVPSGYKIDHNAKSAKGVITEMVPQAQSVNDWTEMVTVQIFFELKQAPAVFKNNIAQLWKKACPDSAARDVWQGKENGYPAELFLLACPSNPQTGKPEITWFKAIQGDDSFYVVQKASKFMPANEEITPWMDYLNKVSACDSRRVDRPCPKVSPPAR